MRASSRESKRTLKIREDCTGQVDTSGWHIGHEGYAQGSDDPNKTPRGTGTGPMIHDHDHDPNKIL